MRGRKLRAAVERVLADPSGRGRPGHRYTKTFHNPEKYVTLEDGVKVWEFCPNQWRGLFMTADAQGDGPGLLLFVPVRGKRFLTKNEAPWH